MWSPKLLCLDSRYAILVVLLGAHAASGHRVSGPIIIESPAGAETFATDLNDKGVVTGFRADPVEHTQRAYVWTKTRGLVDLPDLQSSGSLAWGINNCGEVVGEADPTGEGGHAVRWTPDGELEDLGTLGGRSSEARAINDRGNIVGHSLTRTPDETRAFLWTQEHGMRDLGSIGNGRTTVAADINNHNAVIGRHDLPDGRERAFVWTAKTGIVDLTPPGAEESRAEAINDKGEIIGTFVADGKRQLIEWTWKRGAVRKTVVGYPTLEGAEVDLRVPSDINNRGQVAGEVKVLVANDIRRAVVWLNPRRVVNLDPDFGVTSTADAINDRGQVAGNVTLGDPLRQFNRAVVWQLGTDGPRVCDEEKSRSCGRCLH
jgi:probable HAF family extracellular repeat protein